MDPRDGQDAYPQGRSGGPLLRRHFVSQKLVRNYPLHDELAPFDPCAVVMEECEIMLRLLSAYMRIIVKPDRG